MRTATMAMLGGWTILLLNGLAAAAPPAPADPKGIEFFEQHIRPLLVEHCYQCHSEKAKKLRGELLLDSRAGWQKGGESGPVIVPGVPDKSLFIKAIRYEDGVKMPPKGKLSAKQIDLLTQWVKLGAPDPRDGRPTPVTQKTIDLAQGRQYWAFQPLRPVAPPTVKNEAWCRTPVDHFILARLEAKGLTPNRPTERRKLIRRAAFDLTGLPPTPAEVEAFVNDPAPDAYSRLLDRLLASPHFGERWARHWLDVARFAESHGYEQDYDRPNAYHYRDFVIKAFNQDLPYDTFVKWQLAGDELEPDNPLALMATGFLAAGTHATQITANQAEKERYDELDDMARTIGTTMLGLTIGCARCHDHKFDPIPNADYFRLLATFATTVRSVSDVNLDPQSYRLLRSRFEAEQAALTAALAKFEKTDPQRRKLQDLLEQHARRAPRPQTIKVLISSEGVPALRTHTQGLDFYDPVHFLTRGDPNQKGAVATQSFLQVLMRDGQPATHWQQAPPPGWHTSYRRRNLANWLTDVDHGAGPLLARVIVNRLWHHHLGRGIVATPSDFGKQGEQPTHPELLDFLARELIRNGWRLKPIHKLIMSSAVYVQNGDTDEKRALADRDNTLFWRRAPRRLEAEAIRDAMLAVSGTLDPRMFGPGTLDPQQPRRSIYFFVKRSRLVPMMTLFDAPDSLQDIANRPTTTIAPQALLLMNSTIIRGYAANLARRLKPAAGTTLSESADRGYALALGRPPTSVERADAVAFLQEQMKSYQADGKADAAELALGDFCQTLLSLNEFVYIE